MGSITISVHAAIAEAFRGIPVGKRERYNRIFTTLLVEGASIEQFVEEVMAEINDYAQQRKLTPSALMHLLDEDYEDLLSHQGADLAEAEDGEHIPLSEIKRAFGLT